MTSISIALFVQNLLLLAIVVILFDMSRILEPLRITLDEAMEEDDED